MVKAINTSLYNNKKLKENTNKKLNNKKLINNH